MSIKGELAIALITWEVMKMAFKAAFIAHAPDAEPEKHRCMVDTGKYVLFVVVVRDQSQAIAAARDLVAREGVHSILLCPGIYPRRYRRARGSRRPGRRGQRGQGRRSQWPCFGRGAAAGMGLPK